MDCKQPEARADCSDGYCRIEPGCFSIGAPRDEWGAAKFADRQAEVRLTRAFSFGATEVTRAQWQESGLAMPTRTQLAGSADCLDESCPVTQVSFFDAVAYANRRSEMAGLPSCYDTKACTGVVGESLFCPALTLTTATPHECEGFRLPTEAEWEYATRAGTDTAFYAGPIAVLDSFDCAADPTLERMAWYCFNSDGRPHPVGHKEPNGWGLFDLAGNVFEWTSDVYHPDGYGEGPFVDPAGRLIQDMDLMPKNHPWGKLLDPPRIARGGNHVSPSTNCRSAARFYAQSLDERATGSTDSGLGVRLARTLR